MAVVVPGERAHVLAAGGLAPLVDQDAGALALPGVGGQDLAVALAAGALAHVQLAGVVVVAGVHLGEAAVEQGGVEGVAVAVRADLVLPALGALRLVGVRHVPGKDGAGAEAAHAPRVSEGLPGLEVAAVAAKEVVGLVTVEVAAEAAEAIAILGRHGQLQEADPVPENFDAWKRKKERKRVIYIYKKGVEYAITPTLKFDTCTSYAM